MFENCIGLHADSRHSFPATPYPLPSPPQQVHMRTVNQLCTHVQWGTPWRGYHVQVQKAGVYRRLAVQSLASELPPVQCHVLFYFLPSCPSFLSIIFIPSLPPSPSSDVSVNRKQLRCASTKAMEREQVPLFKRFWRWLHDLDDLERLDTPVRKTQFIMCIYTHAMYICSMDCTLSTYILYIHVQMYVCVS